MFVRLKAFQQSRCTFFGAHLGVQVGFKEGIAIIGSGFRVQIPIIDGSNAMAIHFWLRYLLVYL